MYKRYNNDFVAFLELICRESGHVNLVNERCYENFLELTKEEMIEMAMKIIGQTAGAFNRKHFSDAWDSDDDMYSFVMTFLELIAEGKLVFDEETGKMGFCKEQVILQALKCGTESKTRLNHLDQLFGKLS